MKVLRHPPMILPFAFPFKRDVPEIILCLSLNSAFSKDAAVSLSIFSSLKS